MLNVVVITLMASMINTSTFASESKCFGSVSNGYLVDGVQLPKKGKNFKAYSSLGTLLGRNYVHSATAAITLKAYKNLEVSNPNTIYVYGETGWSGGGRIRPHKTHRNGTSVDFMVPILNKDGVSVPLPTGITHKFGYSIDFDSSANFDDYHIDFEAIAEHLYQLDKEAKTAGYKLALVIFDPPYMPKLLATKRGAYLKANIPFMKGNAWIRHDEHYHVDFAIPCEPISNQTQSPNL